MRAWHAMAAVGSAAVQCADGQQMRGAPNGCGPCAGTCKNREAAAVSLPSQLARETAVDRERWVWRTPLEASRPYWQACCPVPPAHVLRCWHGRGAVHVRVPWKRPPEAAAARGAHLAPLPAPLGLIG